MDKNRMVLIFSLMVNSAVFAQYYEPQSPLVFDGNAIQKSLISQKIRAERTMFTQGEIDELKLQIIRNNNEVDNQTAVIKNKISGLFIDKQELLKLADIKKMQEQITAKQQNRRQIEEQIEQDLANIGFQGLYLILINGIDPWASRETLMGQAEKLLAPEAVNDLNGLFLSSFTVVQDNLLLVDRIKTRVSGQMTVEKQNISKIIENRTRFLYVVRVSVAPLKKSAILTGQITEASSRSLVLNLLNDAQYKIKLRAAGLDEAEIRAVELEVISSREVTDGTNSLAGRRQQQIIRTGSSNLYAVDTEIEQLKTSLANRSSILKQVITGKTNVV